jgi:hypothetical protein
VDLQLYTGFLLVHTLGLHLFFFFSFFFLKKIYSYTGFLDIQIYVLSSSSVPIDDFKQRYEYFRSIYNMSNFKDFGVLEYKLNY